MAKLVLLFIVIFCIVQLTFAARIRRDKLDDVPVGALLNGNFDTSTQEYDDTQFGEAHKRLVETLNEAYKMN
uniref:Putative salivary secreted peptide n=1 Tax=Psorophora albipes TaxID=869069 RepID=T1DG27_9DIPT